MVFFIVAAVAVLAWIISIKVCEEYSAWRLFLGGAAMFLVVFSIFIQFSAIGSSYHDKMVVNAPLAQINDGQTINGHFYFLGGGYINQIPSYTYYMRSPNGSYSLHEIAASHATVFQDSQSPSIVCYQSQRVLDNKWSLYGPHYHGRKQCTFHIPPGSIVTAYKLGGK